ncbi:hypothetical protein BBB56_09010 [Candidatus Pantoea deserta]|uniref:DNA utilization protein HofO C-terminal domain-containing protein n=1 Tax=Candidatus Pantoea deserta TaxID=1869313 RepID=A0A3N4P502_9GAMM|nr:hypothetical protein [Pantoea deserta]RPE01419.1 hypothetical protein BBB56_09010 [Pantoea deserta]
MNSLMERWLYLGLRGQLAVATAGLATLALATGMLLVRPQRLAQQALRADLAALEQQYQQRQAQLNLLPAEALLRAQLSDLAREAERVSARASLEAVLAARGEQLDTWQPESDPRRLTLQLAWSQFQPLFAELAQAVSPFPVRFLLEAQQGKLQVSLWLENLDAR